MILSDYFFFKEYLVYTTANLFQVLGGQFSGRVILGFCEMEVKYFLIVLAVIFVSFQGKIYCVFNFRRLRLIVKQADTQAINPTGRAPNGRNRSTVW